MVAPKALPRQVRHIFPIFAGSSCPQPEMTRRITLASRPTGDASVLRALSAFTSNLPRANVGTRDFTLPIDHMHQEWRVS